MIRYSIVKESVAVMTDKSSKTTVENVLFLDFVGLQFGMKRETKHGVVSSLNCGVVG